MAKFKQSNKTTAAAVASAVVTGILMILQIEGIITTEKMAVYMSVANGLLAAFGFSVAKDYNVTGSPPRDVEDVTTIVKPKVDPK